MTQFKPTTKSYRLHNISPLFLALESLKKMVLPLLIGLVGTKGELQDWIFIGIVAFAAIATIFQFWFYHYWLEEDRLVVKEGILFKSLRQIPYQRIQNLNIERNILHKIFNVATLQIESASGSRPEATIRVISNLQVKRIQDIVKGKSELTDHSKKEQTEQDKPLFELSNKEVTKYGFISHRSLLPVGIIISIISQSDSLRAQAYSYFEGLIGSLHVELWGYQQWLFNGLAFTVTLLLMVWLSSILLSFLQLYQFKLSKVNSKLQAEMGLLTKLSSTIPIKRIQLIRIGFSPLHKWFNRQTIKMETAGGVTEHSGLTMSWIAPLISPQKGGNLLSQIHPEINWHKLNWQPLEKRAWRRIFKKNLFFTLIPISIISYFYPAYSLWFLLTVPLIFAYAKAYIKKAAYTMDERIIAFRSGIFFHKISIVKLSKVQTFTQSESPFDRRNKMACITVDTAGSNMAAHNVHIHYLDKDKILNLKKQLSERVSQSQFVW
ncbi:MAG: PH domain-containing protein [Proteobacteria bacterium]|nr:PH domain-containing protein [Pseudomonadota bacterium]